MNHKSLLLFGDFETVIDGKRRVAISSTFRELIDPAEHGADFIVMLGPDRHLWLYPDLYFHRLAGSLRRSALSSEDRRRIDLYFAMARLVKPDSQGRVVLPEKSMQRAVTSDRVTLSGNKDHIEIWPSDEWDRHVSAGLETAGEALSEALYAAADRLQASDGGDAG